MHSSKKQETVSKCKNASLPDQAVWDASEKALENQPDGKKYSFESGLRKYSFLSINGKSWLRGATIGEGSFGKVKYCISADEEILAIKILPEGYREDFLTEAAVWEDLDLSAGYFVKRKKNALCEAQQAIQYYLPIRCFGKSNLREYLKLHPDLNEEERLTLAIGIALAVDRLHRGLDSKSKTAYAHLDLKPENIVIDEAGKPHLIDFGFTSPEPKSERFLICGTPAYLLYSRESVTKEQADIFALKRTFCLESGYSVGGYKDFDSCRTDNLLHRGLLKDYGLTPYISTFSREQDHAYYNEDTLTANAMAAILIAARYDLKIDRELLKEDARYALALTTLYSHGASIDEIRQKLSDRSEVKFIAALAACNEYKVPLDDGYKHTPVYANIAQSLTLQEACMYLHGEQNILFESLCLGTAVVLGAGLGLTLAITGAFTPLGIGILAVTGTAALFAAAAVFIMGLVMLADLAVDYAKIFSENHSAPVLV